MAEPVENVRWAQDETRVLLFFICEGVGPSSVRKEVVDVVARGKWLRAGGIGKLPAVWGGLWGKVSKEVTVTFSEDGLVTVALRKKVPGEWRRFLRSAGRLIEVATDFSVGKTRLEKGEYILVLESIGEGEFRVAARNRVLEVELESFAGADVPRESLSVTEVPLPPEYAAREKSGSLPGSISPADVSGTASSGTPGTILGYSGWGPASVPPYVARDPIFVGILARTLGLAQKVQACREVLSQHLCAMRTLATLGGSVASSLKDLLSCTDVDQQWVDLTDSYATAHESILRSLGLENLSSAIQRLGDVESDLKKLEPLCEREAKLRENYEELYRSLLGMVDESQIEEVADIQKSWSDAQNELYEAAATVLSCRLDFARLISSIVETEVRGTSAAATTILRLQNFCVKDAEEASEEASETGDTVSSGTNSSKRLQVFSVRQLMSNSLGLKYLKEFMEGEKNSETVLFVWEVDEFCRRAAKFSTDAKPPEEIAAALRKDAVRIYRTYVVDGARLQINISDDSSASVRARLDKPSLETFARARDDAMHLMETFVYPRFCESSAGVKFSERTGIELQKFIPRRASSVAVGLSSVASGSDRADSDVGSTGSLSAREGLLITIDDQFARVPEGTTVLVAARSLGIYIPSLCYHPRLGPLGRCKTCVVTVMERGTPTCRVSCSLPVKDGMVVMTSSEECNNVTVKALSDLLRRRDARLLPMSGLPMDKGEVTDLLRHVKLSQVDRSSPSMQRDAQLCLECYRCTHVCGTIQGQHVLISTASDDGLVTTANGLRLKNTACVECGQCTLFCPSGAVSERSYVEELRSAKDAGQTLIAIVAPACRTAVGEGFGMLGVDTSGRMVAALRRCGFKYVFDNQFAADLTIVEEATELLGRLAGKGKLPMFTSCCPAWINVVEKMYPTLIPNISTCRSPQQMSGSLVKTYVAEKLGLDPKELYVVSFVPCVAKKGESLRPEFVNNGLRDIDCAMTTREMISMFHSDIGITDVGYNELVDEVFDSPLGSSTGAAALFAATGGVMEAALRTAYERVTSEKLEPLEFLPCRGLAGVKEASLVLAGQVLNVAVVNSGAKIHALVERILKGEVSYHFVEVMFCPGGCLGGGGQPQSCSEDVLQQRLDATYSLDRGATVRLSHENEDVRKLYSEILGEVGGAVAHRLLHTSYCNRTMEVMEAVGALSSGLMEYRKPTSKKRILILHASQTGATTRVAKEIQDALVEQKYKVECCRMDMYPTENLEKEQGVVFVLTSTHWDGNTPETGVKFWNWLSELKSGGEDAGRLSGLRYLAFGLGDKQFVHFNLAIRNIDEKLTALGGVRLGHLGLADVSEERGLETALRPWLEQAIKSVHASVGKERAHEGASKRSGRRREPGKEGAVPSSKLKDPADGGSSQRFKLKIGRKE